ncbi:MAG: hypothetical protein HYV63_12990 [Candidatus Schekmanbacteria bacterium]|nr:hypothetical protein [Candidatus Schekmanbacteria bacterium]
MTEGPLLILLVGSNPLPSYLSACAQRPSRVALVYTEETKDAKDRLRRELARALGEGVTFDEPFVSDATCATTVRRVLDSLVPSDGDRDVLLSYTGGTKVMAAHARLAFSSRGRPEHASYLDEGDIKREARLRFDDGNSKPLSDYSEPPPLTLATVLALHGITHKPREARTPAPTTGDAREILCKVLADLPLAAALYRERERLQEISNPNKATSEPFRADRYGLRLSLPELPTSEQLSQFQNADEKKSWFRQWYASIGGEWLEEWLGAQIRALDLAPAPEITVGVNARWERAKKEDPPMEIDLAVIRGHRSYFISCTTDASKDLCKSKLFEIAVRSRQLGGDLARAALVCLADDRTASALQRDVDDVWGASNTTKVFGISDVRAWSDCEGKQPNRHPLKAWLES